MAATRLVMADDLSGAPCGPVISLPAEDRIRLTGPLCETFACHMPHLALGTCGLHTILIMIGRTAPVR